MHRISRSTTRPPSANDRCQVVRRGTDALRLWQTDVVATRIGIISDTHGLVRPEALRALEGSDRIVHAGDIGTRDVLAALAAIAPVTAVRGNNDTAAWARALGDTAAVETDGVRLWVLHDVGELDLSPRAAGIAAVIAGHSHRPSIQSRDGALFVNPGSAGPRRFHLPVSIARMVVDAGAVRAELVTLEV